MDQQPLFAAWTAAEELRARVAATTEAERKRAAAQAARKRRARATVLQLDLWGDPLPVRVWIPATAEKRKPGPPKRPKAVVVDIFAWAAAGKTLSVRRAGSEERPACSVVIREDGVVRHIARRMQETEEWAEQERARRARQKPPRPPKAAGKFRMKNSRAWDGNQS